VEDAYPFGQFHHAVMKKDFKEDQFKNYLSQKLNTGIEIKAAQPGIEDCFMNLMKN
jgi:hypothetical protein